MTDRVVCCLTISLFMGILFGKYGNPWLAGGLLAMLLYTGQNIARHQEKSWKVLLVRSMACILVFCFGNFHFRAELKMRNELEEVLQEGESLTIQGEVLRKEEKAEQCLYDLTNVKVLAGGRIYPCFGILVYSSEMHIQPGNVLHVTGEYAPFQTPRNEGNFNEKQYYQSKKTEFRLYAKQIVLKSAKEDRFALFLRKIRQKFRDVYVRCMSENHAGLMADMTLGDKSLLTSEIRELYQDAGIGHVLAISGLHVSLFGMGVFRLLQKCSCPLFIRILVAAGVVCSFGQLSGMEISTFRAVCMFCLFMAAQLLGYSYDSLTALSISAAIQLWENPFLPDYAGFLFSYGAVLGVAVVARILKEDNREKEQDRRRNRLIQKWKDTVFISICIQFATLPLTLYFYYEVSCYNILVNGCILPFLGILLLLGILGAFVGTVFPLMGKFILTPAGWLLTGNEQICRMVLKLPGAELITGKPEISLVFLYYGILIFVLYLRWHRKSLSCSLQEYRGDTVSLPVRFLWSGAGKVAAYTGIVFALGMLLFLRERPEFEIHVLDVGQGDGIFIQTEEGETFFVDGGSSDVKQVGTYRILPFLKSKGIPSIQGWMVSHADLDHISGLKEVMESGYPVEYLILAENMVRDEAFQELLLLAEKAGCSILFAAPGMRFGTQTAIFTVWHPKEGTDERDRNGASLVVSLEYQGFTGIFTGDIGEKEEQQLSESQKIRTWMERHGVEQIDFYKAAHHGSNGSNSGKFLEELSPRLTVISCGKGNSYGHPGKEALERIENTGSRTFCTMDSGQVTVRFQEGKMQAETFLAD